LQKRIGPFDLKTKFKGMNQDSIENDWEGDADRQPQSQTTNSQILSNDWNDLEEPDCYAVPNDSSIACNDTTYCQLLPTFKPDELVCQKTAVI
jgi:hypothetical protein